MFLDKQLLIIIAISSIMLIHQSIKYINKALLISADISKCYTETQPKTPANNADVEARWLGKTP